MRFFSDPRGPGRTPTPESTGTRSEGQIPSYFRVFLLAPDLRNQTKRDRIACMNTTERAGPLFSNSPICLPYLINQYKQNWFAGFITKMRT
jgi:hypothetical protein